MAYPNNPNGIRLNDNRIFVQGEQGANYYPIGGINSVVLLMDSSEPIFYIKSTDASGIIQPLKKFRYEEIIPEPEESPYVTKEDFNKKFEELLAAINSNNNKHYYNNKKGDNRNEQS